MVAKTKADVEEASKIAAATVAAVLASDIHHINSDIAEIKKSIDKMCDIYLTKVEFEPVKKVVYGLVSIILIAVVGGLLALVIIHK